MTGPMPRERFALFLYGQTATGKSDLAIRLAEQVPAEIVNMDAAQLYTPLTIGVAKPAWREQPATHHLFDLMDRPDDCTVVQYKSWLDTALHGIWQRGKLPIVVGGSGFYLRSLFFPPQDSALSSALLAGQEISWQALHAIDPVRAAQIDPHDTYRIQRALEIWYRTGKKPSRFTPVYQPPCHAQILFLTRDREQLYARINARTAAMVAEGLLEEASALCDTPWEPFLCRKGFIGYAETFDYLRSATRCSCELIEKIAQRTRRYAKRQGTFWRGLERHIKTAQEAAGSNGYRVQTELVNLTAIGEDRYIDRLSSQLSRFSQE